MADDAPRTRTDLKRSGKKDKGPYSMRHVRAAERLLAQSGSRLSQTTEALAERRAAAGGQKPPAPTGPKKK